MLIVVAVSLMASAAPRNVEAKIVSASMFKNGYAVVFRQFDAPAPGTYQLEKLPQSAMGTLWFTVSDGMKLDEVIATRETVQSKSEIDTSKGILAANIGKQIRIGIRNGDKVEGDIQEGRLECVGEDYVILHENRGSILIPISQVSSFESNDSINHEAQTRLSHGVVSIRVSGKSGTVSMVSLERGMTWSPAYAIDISDPKKVTVVAKATMLDDLEDVSNIEARFVTGFPNVPFATYLEPLVSGSSVSEFGAMLTTMSGLANGSVVANGRRGGENRGIGFAGQMAQNTLAPMASDFSDAMSSPLLGSQQEDLFVYKQPNVTVRQGDRSYQILFKAEAPYAEIYTLDLPDSTLNNTEYRGVDDTPPDVWHTLRFKNTSGQPFTTAVATTFKNGEILGQDTMHYVSSGQTAEVKITKALDVRAEQDEAEVSREREAIKRNNGYPSYDLITLKGTIRIINFKGRTVSIRIKKELTGEVSATEGAPVVTKSAKGLRSMNPGQKIEWSKDVEPGKSVTLTYTYKLYVRSS